MIRLWPYCISIFIPGSRWTHSVTAIIAIKPSFAGCIVSAAGGIAVTRKSWCAWSSKP